MNKKVKRLAMLSFWLLFLMAFAAFGARLVAKAGNDRRDYKIYNDTYSAVYPLRPGAVFEQPFFQQEGAVLYGVRLNIAAFNRVNHGTAQAELFDEAGNLCASSSCNMIELLDNTFYTFVFNQRYIVPQDQTLSLRLSYQPHSEEDRIGIWVSEGPACEEASDGQGNGLNASAALQVLVDYSGSGIGKTALFLFALFALAVLGAAVLICHRKWIAAFAVSALLLGFGASLILPPLCGPDEYVHAAGSYALANTVLGEQGYDEEGKLRVRACDKERFTDETGPSGAFVYADVLRDLAERDKENALTEHVRVRAPGNTPFYLYLPAALGILTARLAGLGFYAMLLMGRLFNLAFYIAAGCVALWLMPYAKRLMFALLLLPSMLFAASAFSADTVLIGLAFVYTAFCLNMVESQRSPTLPKLAAVLVLAALLAPAKAVYLPIVFLFALVPANRFVRPEQKGRAMAAILLASVFSWLLCNLTYIRYILRDVNELAVLGGVLLIAGAVLVILRFAPKLVRFARGNKKICIVLVMFVFTAFAIVLTMFMHVGGKLTPEQMAEGIMPNGDSVYTYSVGYTLRHLPEVLLLLCRTAVLKCGEIWQQLLGLCPGEPIVHKLALNPSLQAAEALVLFASLCSAKTDKKPGKTAVLTFAAVSAVIVVLITAACLTWTPINYSCLFGWQGRYLLPILPLLGLTVQFLLPFYIEEKNDSCLSVETAAVAVSALALANTFYLFALL